MEKDIEKKDIIIVGAGPAGLSAAIFTQLDGWNTLVLESDWVGGQERSLPQSPIIQDFHRMMAKCLWKIWRNK